MKSNKKQRGGRRRKNRRSKQATPSPRVQVNQASEEVERYTGEPGGTRSLELLRERIEAAAREIHRLRQENAELADKIAALEKTQGNDLRTILEVDAPPEQVREKILGFINAIDRYFSHHTEEQESSSRSPESPNIDV